MFLVNWKWCYTPFIQCEFLSRQIYLLLKTQILLTQAVLYMLSLLTLIAAYMKLHNISVTQNNWEGCNSSWFSMHLVLMVFQWWLLRTMSVKFHTYKLIISKYVWRNLAGCSQDMLECCGKNSLLFVKFLRTLLITDLLITLRSYFFLIFNIVSDCVIFTV